MCKGLRGIHTQSLEYIERPFLSQCHFFYVFGGKVGDTVNNKVLGE